MRTKEKNREYNQRNYRKHRAKRLAYAAAYRAANREKLIAYQRERRKKDGDRVRALERARRLRNKDRVHAIAKRYRQTAKFKAWLVAYKVKNRDRVKEQNRRGEANRKIKKQMDAAYYHKRLLLNRVRHAKARIAQGKKYRPRFHLRLPEWATMGTVDVRSAFLIENLTPSQRDYARELAIERMERK